MPDTPTLRRTADNIPFMQLPERLRQGGFLMRLQLLNVGADAVDLNVHVLGVLDESVPHLLV